MLKHLCAAKLQPEDSIQIHVIGSKEPLSPRAFLGLQPQPPSRFNFLPLALTDMEIQGLLSCACIKKKCDKDSKGGKKQYWPARLGGAIHMGQEACLPTVTRTLTLVMVPIFGYSEFPPRKEKESSRKKYGLKTGRQCQEGCQATIFLGGTFRHQTQIIFIMLWSILYAGRSYMWGLLVIWQVFLCQLP